MANLVTKKMLIGGVLSVLAIGNLQALTNEYNYQVYGVQPEKDVKIKLDGKLDEAEWKRTPSLGEFHFIKNIDDQTESRQTVSRVFYTPEAIYIGIECYETDIDGIFRKIKNNSNKTYWSDDCLEIYLETGRTYKKFYKLAINPNGVLWAMRVKNDDYDDTWQARSGVAGGASVGKDRWTVEIKFPYKSFSQKPQAGNLWTFNIRRIRWGRKHKLEDSSWSPGASYSNPWRFGHLYFEKEAGHVDIATLLELSRENDGSVVEVMMGKGRMFLESNAGIIDRKLKTIGKLLTQADMELKSVKLPDAEMKKMVKRYEECQKSFQALMKQRGKGEVSAETLAIVMLPTNTLCYEISALIWDLKWQQMSIQQ